ncbi:thiamine ABC transporter substrate binding subunit [Algicella marina]|uniref:Thiamine-binding periplasmic protein n=1 Tax=Algicella marina TaxID=2683284 RepID=A0A6P1T4Q7_9RHOB|nr:thiamine ABC transporter substrate binding subunit [Algicella marina]QHQ36987.1 thiamine ABC transporter substrate binding subunit [Algicella marina]
MRTFLTSAALALLAGSAAAQTPTLTVYTYDSFVAEWGPGPQIEAAFEETCGCDLNFVSAGDGAALLARVRLEGERTEADIVLGLDTSLTEAATATGLFAEHGGAPADLTVPVEWNDPIFLPYDWSHFAFIYDETRLSEPPASFRELAESDLSVVIQDPRSSTPGLSLVFWVKAAYGDEAQAMWEALAPRILTVTKGWSESYSMFLEGEADMVLSYTTSPAYHMVAEEDDTKHAAPFTEGHYTQVEVAGILKSTDQPDLARDFMAFMLTDAFQSIIPTTNWMYPAVATELDPAFGKLITPEKALLFPPEEAEALRKTAIEEWQEALSQ